MDMRVILHLPHTSKGAMELIWTEAESRAGSVPLHRLWLCPACPDLGQELLQVPVSSQGSVSSQGPAPASVLAFLA